MAPTVNIIEFKNSKEIIQFLILKRENELNLLEEEFNIKFIKDESNKLKFEESNNKSNILNKLLLLIKGWEQQDIVFEDLNDSLSKIMNEIIESRYKLHKNVFYSVESISSFSSNCSDTTFKLYGINEVQKEFEKIKLNFNPTSAQPTVKYSIIKKNLDSFNSKISKNSILVINGNSFILHSINLAGWKSADETISLLSEHVPDESSLSNLTTSTSIPITSTTLTTSTTSTISTISPSNTKSISFEKVYYDYIKFYMEPVWIEKTLSPILLTVDRKGFIIFNEHVSKDIIHLVKSEIDQLNNIKFNIQLPFSFEIYQKLIIGLAKTDRLWVLWDDHNTEKSKWKSCGIKQKDKKNKNNKNNNNNNNYDKENILSFTILGLVKNQCIKLKEFIENLKNNCCKIVLLNANQKLIKFDWKSLNDSNVNIQFVNGDIKIEATTKEHLINSIKLVENKLSLITNIYKKFEFNNELEIDYLLKSKINEEFPIKIVGKTTLSIESNEKTILLFEKKYKDLLKHFHLERINLTDNELKEKIKLLSKFVKGMEEKIKKEQLDCLIKISNLKNDERKFDFGNIFLFGTNEDVEKIKNEMITFKNSIHFQIYEPDNKNELIKLANNELKPKIIDIENKFNCTICTKSDGLIRICSGSKETHQLIESELQALVSKVPNELVSFNLTNKFYASKMNKKIIELEKKSKQLNVRYNYNPIPLIITISGDPIKVHLMLKELEKEKKLIDDQCKTKTIQIDKMTQDLLFVYKHAHELQKKNNVNVKSNEHDNYFILGNGKKIKIQYGDITKQKVKAIVNPANSSLCNAGGAACAIEKAAGDQFKTACQNYIKQYGTLVVGNAIGSNIFKLNPNTFIINAVGPNCTISEQSINKAHLLESAIRNSLIQCEKLKIDSIAIPAISSGLFSFEIEDSAPIFISTIVNYLSTNLTYINEVWLIDIQQKTIDSLEKELIFYTNGIKQKLTLSSTYSPIIKQPINYRWSWTDDNGGYTPYDEDQAIQIETAFKSSKKSVIIVGDLNQVKNNKRYSVIFNDEVSFFQKNIDTGYTRKVKRELINGPSVEQQIAQPQRPTSAINNSISSFTIKKEKPIYSITIKGFEDNIKSFEDGLNHLVKSKKINTTIPDLKLSEFDYNEILLICDLIGVDIKKSDSSKSNSTSEIVLIGIKEKVLEIKSTIYQKNQISSKLDDIVYPKGWDNTTDRVLIPVDQNSQEWLSIDKKIKTTLPNAKLISVDIVQNKLAFEDYNHSKKQMLSKLNGSCGELELFHGTRSNNPLDVCYSQKGFDFRYSNERCMWGAGSYFAVNASYSNSYAYTGKVVNGENVKQFFIAKVLTGDYVTLPPQQIILPPTKQNSQYDRYDSVCGNTNGSDVFIIYDNKQSYPYYLVTYRC